MTQTKASLFGEIRSICGQLEEVIFPQEKGEIRTLPIYWSLEDTLKNALSSQIISWHEYQSEIAPYLSARINRWHVPLWFWARWYEKKEAPSSLLANAISVFDPKELLGVEPFISQIRVLSYKVLSYEYSELSLKMPNLQTLITNTFFKQQLSSSDAPSLQRVVYSPAYGSDFNYQENLTHTDVPHVGFMVDSRDSLSLESLILPPTLETLLLYRVNATRLSFAPSESLKELYLRDFPVFRRQELSLAELFPSLEVLYLYAWSAAPWTDRDILGWFIDAKGNPVPLPPNLKVVFTDLPDVINFLKREHPQVKIVPITKQNADVEAMYVHLLHLERLHGLDLRAPKLL